MATRANIVIKDGAAAPVNHTFVPLGRPNGGDSEVYVERVSGKPEFQSELRVKTVQPTRKDQPYKVSMTLIVPKTKQVGDVDVLDRQVRADISFVLSGKSVTQDRKDLRALVTDLLSNIQIASIVDNLETIVG